MAAERGPEIATATSASRLGPSSRADEVSAGHTHTGGVVGAVSSTALRRAPAHLAEEVLSPKIGDQDAYNCRYQGEGTHAEREIGLPHRSNRARHRLLDLVLDPGRSKRPSW